jgi:hypothetical protein
MNSLRTLGTVVGSACILLAGGCKPSLDVTNPNAPDVGRALASPEDVRSLAISSVNSWYLASNNVEPWLMMSVTSDAGTANFGNFGMRFNNLEPRIAYANNSAGGDRGVTESPWNNFYSALGAANDAIKAFQGGIVLKEGQDETDKYMRLAQFTQAASLTELALIFDQAFITDESFTPGDPVDLSPYTDVAAAAVAKWEALAAAEAGKTDEYDPSDLPMPVGPLTSSRLARIANTMAALTLAYTPRNAAEAATVDWSKVATLADKGIGTGSAGAPFDFTVIGDFNTWYADFLDYSESHSWISVDMRLIHRMDPNSPEKFTGTIPAEGSSADARFASDFRYDGTVVGDPSRGIYMQSPYTSSRYDYYSFEGPTEEEGPAPYILAAESDLVRAEALIRTNGDLGLAASLINNTRVGRGQLAPATAADGATTLLSYIDYERDVELHNSAPWMLFRRRHVDGLQAGTVHHLPVPAKELETLNLPIYTFGGPGAEQSLTPLGGSTLASRLVTGDFTASIELPTGEVLPLRFPARPSRAARQGRR